MKKLHLSYFRSPFAALLMSLVLGGLTPVAAIAASSPIHLIATTRASASIDSASLSIDSGERPYISGNATSTNKVRFVITAPDKGTTKTIYKSNTLRVRNHHWGSSISFAATRHLKDGTYAVTVYDYSTRTHPKLAEGTLYVGMPHTVLKVASIPLLFGTVAHPSSVVPVSYLQVVNRSTATTSIKGFWLEQDGTAPTSTIIGFTSLDGKGGSQAAVGGAEGSVLFKNGKAFVPSTAVLAPGEMRLFTIKAQLSSLAAWQGAGKSLMLSVAGVDTGAPTTYQATFPIRGTTWVIGS